MDSGALADPEHAEARQHDADTKLQEVLGHFTELARDDDPDERNDYRRLLTGRSTINAVLGSERVFGFGSQAASRLPYAEVLTEVRRVGRRWLASEGHHLDDGPLEATQFDIDLTAWVESPSVHQVVGPIREVHGDDVTR